MIDEDKLVSSQDFIELGASVLRRAPGLHTVDYHRLFRALLGASPRGLQFFVVSALRGTPLGKQTDSFVVGSGVLKVYATEHVHAALAGVDEKIYRKWEWMFFKLAGSLQLVSYFIAFFNFRAQYNSLCSCEVGAFFRSSSGLTD